MSVLKRLRLAHAFHMLPWRIPTNVVRHISLVGPSDLDVVRGEELAELLEPRCLGCGGRVDNNWFDRSLCPCDDVMHTRCDFCGYALDGCPYNPESVVGGVEQQ